MGRKKGRRNCIKSCLSVDAQTIVDADTAAPVQITPTGGGGLEELFKAMQNTVCWKLKQSKTEIENPNPIKEHLLKTYITPDSSLKAALNNTYPNLGLSSPQKMLKDHPLCVRLFLFSLCAMLCGQREDYQVDPWEFVATAWSVQDCTREDMETVCVDSLFEYFDLYDEGDIEEQQVADFLGHCEVSMLWPADMDDFNSFSTYLKTTFQDRSLLERLIGPSYEQEWNANTKIFLFAMLSLVSSGQNTNHRKWLCEAVAGCGEYAFRKIKSDVFIEPFATHIERQASPIPIPFEEANVGDSSDGRIVVEDDSSNEDESTAREETQDLRVVDSAIATLRQCLDMPPENRPKNAHNFLHWVAHEVLKENKEEDICTLTYRSQNNTKSRQFSVSYAALPRPHKSSSNLERHAIRNRVNRIKRFVHHQAAVEGSEDTSKAEEEFLFARVAKEYDLIAIPEKDFNWTHEEIAVIRSEVNLSGNQILKLDRLERHLKGNTRYCPQLSKRMREFESSDVLSIEKEFLDLKMNKEGLRKPCAFWRIMAPHRSLERLVETIFLARKFIPSEEFSSIDHSLIFAFGCDKDTFQTSMLLRCANRSQGNSSQHVSTLALYEKGGENYENLSITILKKDSSTQTFLQSLVDNRLFVLTINTKNLDDENTNIQSECITLDLFADAPGGDSSSGMMLPEIIVKLERGENCFCANENFEVKELAPASPDDEAGEEAGGVEDDDRYSSPSEFNELKKCGIVLDDEWKTGNKFISIKFVADDSEVCSDSNTFYGFRLYVGFKTDNGATSKIDTVPFHAGRFKNPIHRKIGESAIDCNFMQAIGFISCDKKNSWVVQGMPDSVTVANCIVCTQEYNTYKENGPDWMLQYAQEKNLDTSLFRTKYEKGFTDCPLRHGDQSCTVMHARYDRDTGGGNFYVSEEGHRNLKVINGCVKQTPLLEIHPWKQTMGPLHNGAGLENHLKDNLDKLLAGVDAEVIDGEVTWNQQVEDVKKQCIEFIASTKKDLNKLKKGAVKKQKQIESVMLNIERAMNPETRLPSVTDEYVQNMRDKLEDLRNSPEIVAYGRQARLHKGAKELIELIEKYQKSKKPKGPAQYALRKAIQLCGSKFNAQHGGMDLSHAHGMLMLENWSDIAERVKRTYECGSETKHEKVQDLMEKSKAIATPLFEMNKLLKSQKKWDDEKIDKLKHFCYIFYTRWLEYFPWQNVFPKLHDVAWHTPLFVMKYRMYGILSEESFESRHQVHKKEAANLAAMPNVALRVEKFNERLQGSQKPKVQETHAKFKTSLSGKARGPYNTSSNSKSLLISTSGFKCDGDNTGNIRLDKTTSIKQEWLEVYEMCSAGRVPSSWSAIFSDLKEDQAVHTEFTGQT